MSHKKAKAVRKALKLSGIDYRQHDYKMTNLKSRSYVDEAEMQLAKSENPDITQEALVKKVVKFYNTCTLVLQEGCGKQIYRQTKQQMSI